MKRRHSLSLLLSFILACFFIIPVICFAQSIMCPKIVVVKQELIRADTPWEAFQEEVPSQLMSIAIFDGHPKQQATMVPDAETKKNKKRVYIWRLAPKRMQTYWIGCTYDRTNMMLIRPLDSNISTCQVTYDTRITIGGHPSVIEINCK